MSARSLVRTAALLTAPVLLVGVGVLAPTAANAAPAPSSAGAPPAVTLQQEASIVSKAHALLPAPAQPSAKLILTESKDPATEQGATSVEVAFAVWPTHYGPVTVYRTTASFTGIGQPTFTPVSSQTMPYTPDLNAFTIPQFKATSQAAESAALAANPKIDASVMDLRNSDVPHEGLGYVFGTTNTGFVSVSGITGKVTNQ